MKTIQFPDKVAAIAQLDSLITRSIMDGASPEAIQGMKQFTLTQKKGYVDVMHPYAITVPKDSHSKRYETYIKEGGERRKISKLTEEDLYECLYRYYSGEANAIGPKKVYGATLTSLFPQWLEYKRMHGAAETYIVRITSDWKRFYEDQEIANMPIKSMTKLYLDEWAHKMIMDYQMTRKSFTNATVVIRGILTYAVDLEIIPTNPFLQLHFEGRRVFTPERKKASKTQVYTPEEARAIIAMAWEDFKNPGKKVCLLLPLAIVFQFLTGVRVGELCALQYKDIEGDSIHVQRMTRGYKHEVVNHTKTDAGDREIYLTKEALHVIKTCKRFQEQHGYDSNGYIFSIDGQPLVYRNINKAYKRYCERLGIMYRSSHKVRKTFISTLLDNMNHDAVRVIAGHTDLNTTYNSYFFDRSSDKEAKQNLEKALEQYSIF